MMVFAFRIVFVVSLLWTCWEVRSHVPAVRFTSAKQATIQSVKNYTDHLPSFKNSKDTLPLSTRTHWMRAANDALLALSPCPFMAFGTVIVNHTSSFSNPAELGDLICSGINHNNHTGNPTLDGEIFALANCSTILTDPKGRFRLSPGEALAAYETFSLYTNGEPCPMCASAISWAGFKETIYGTSIPTLTRMGWPQIELRTSEVFARSWRLPRQVQLFEEVLSNETTPWFEWQWQPNKACPVGCGRGGELGRCLPI